MADNQPAVYLHQFDRKLLCEHSMHVVWLWLALPRESTFNFNAAMLLTIIFLLFLLDI